MAAVKTYLTRMRRFSHKVGVSMGCDLAQAPVDMRVMGTSVLAVVAVVVKLLVDKGMLTDAELTTAFDAAEPDNYDTEPGLP